MSVLPANIVHLKDLYKNIDLFDRKISYCHQFEKFATEQERADTARKLELKRAQLVKAAEKMTSEGIECEPKYLPRSMKSAPEVATKEQP